MALRRGSSHAAELGFLVAAARTFLEGKSPGETPALGAGPLDWQWLVERAEDERLAALLYAVLRPLPLGVPILDRLRRAWVAGRRQHLLGTEQLSVVLAAFGQEGVPVVPLKGPALAEAFYRDPGLRPFTDLDLFVPKADLPQALRLLSGLGYRPLTEDRPLEFELRYAGAACFVGAGGEPMAFPLDLHWELLGYPGAQLGAPVDAREAWDRTVKVERWGRPGLALSPEDLLIYLALHWAVHHAFAGLIWQLDLALLLRRFGAALDWGAVGERARRWRIRRALGLALHRVEERFGVGAPRAFLADLRPRGMRAGAVAWLLRRRDERRGRLDHALPLLLLDRGADLLRVLARAALPASGWVRSRYGGRSLFRGYLAHYGRVGRIWARLVRAAAGGKD